MIKKRHGRYWIGTSGWHYPLWQGRFYPEGLPVSGLLSFYAGEFGTVEINSTFCQLPSEETTGVSARIASTISCAKPAIVATTVTPPAY